MGPTRVLIEVLFLELAPPDAAWCERAIGGPVEDDPTDVAMGLVAGRVGSGRFLHSTSWRYEQGAVVLTYVALTPRARMTDPVLLTLSSLNEVSGNHEDPRPMGPIGDRAVLAHAIRHLAGLVKDGSPATTRLPEASVEMLRNLSLPGTGS